jgi:hypothetical protein
MGLSAKEKHWGIGLSRDLLNKTFFYHTFTWQQSAKKKFDKRCFSSARFR